MKRIILFTVLLVLMSTPDELQAQAVTFGDSTKVKLDNMSFFPLMRKFKQRAIAAGAEFPKPYGVAGSMYTQRQSMDITSIKFGNLLLEDGNGVINFGESNIKNTVISQQLRADVWVLPFVNVFGMVGRVSTFNQINLNVNLNPPPGSPSQEDLELFRVRTLANLNGIVAGVGTVVAGGYGDFFANVNITFARTFLEEVNSVQKSFVTFPMVGVRTFANVFVGVIYQGTDAVNRGQFTGANGNPLNYEVRYKANRVNYCVGLNKQLGNWSFVIFQGFGDRVNSAVEVGYRFGK